MQDRCAISEVLAATEPRSWLVDVTDYTGLRGEQVPVDAVTQAEAVAAAIDITPPNLTVAARMADITDATPTQLARVQDEIVAAAVALAETGGLGIETATEAAAHPVDIFGLTPDT